jgi:uncharacterized protein YlxW (UPF0749 family)
MKVYRNSIALTLVCLLLGTMLSWQFASVKSNRESASIQNKRLDEITEELLVTKKNYDDLAKRNQELVSENLKYEDISGNTNKETLALTNELERVRMAAGLVAVQGKGIIVTLNNRSDTVIDQDILDVLNELRASDAEAISINDERVVAMTEVRLAGKYIMINGSQMVAPFTIKAIADPDKLERSLSIIDGVVEKLQAFLDVKVKPSDKIIIPKVRDDGSVIKTDLLTPVK